jgi:hypothetical protein
MALPPVAGGSADKSFSLRVLEQWVAFVPYTRASGGGRGTFP